MAVLILNQTKCVVCGTPILAGQKSVSFPPFVGNELDPLYLFHDSVAHEECLRQHPLAESAISTVREMQDKTVPNNLLCVACLKPILAPDDYLPFGHLVSDDAHPLFSFNYAQFHRNCLAQWSNHGYVRDLLRSLQRSGKWKGHSLAWLLERF